MNIEKDLSEQLTTLNESVDADSELKEYIINYVGNKLDPEDEQVRGYQQALVDVEEGERLFNESLSESEE